MPDKPLKSRPCPTCKRPATWEGNPSRPFCSERCRLIDLGNWADESYRVPGQKAPESGNDNENDNH